MLKVHSDRVQPGSVVQPLCDDQVTDQTPFSQKADSTFEASQPSNQPSASAPEQSGNPERSGLSQLTPSTAEQLPSAADTAQLLMALGGSTSLPVSHAKHGCGQSSGKAFLPTKMPAQSVRMREEDPDSLLPNPKRHCASVDKACRALHGVTTEVVDSPRSLAPLQQQQQHVLLVQPVASRHRHPLEGVGACGKGFRAYVSPKAQHAAGQKDVPPSAGSSAEQLLHQTSNPSRMSSWTNAALVSGRSLSRSGTTSNAAHLQPVTSTADDTFQPASLPSSRVTQLSNTSSQLAALGSRRSGSSTSSGEEGAPFHKQHEQQHGQQHTQQQQQQQQQHDSGREPAFPGSLPAPTERPLSEEPWDPNPMAEAMAANAGMQPFWNTITDQARENQQAEMTAFCDAYTRAANAAREESCAKAIEAPKASSMQHQHQQMMAAMHSHAVYQRHMMMQQLMLAGMVQGRGAQMDGPAWHTPPGWHMPGMPMPLAQQLSAFSPAAIMPGTAHAGMPAAWHNAAPASTSPSQTAPSLATAPSTGLDSAASLPADSVSLDGASKEFRRTQALDKYKRKRQNLTFAKKIRYESRKQLAKARPRVKGQFVRTDSANVADAEAEAEAEADADGLQEATDAATQAVMHLVQCRQQALSRPEAVKAAYALQPQLEAGMMQLQQAAGHLNARPAS